MDHSSVIKDIKAGNFAPVYLLHGEEPYYIDLLTDAFLEHAMPPSQREFDMTVMYGKDSDVHSLAGVIKRYPMTNKFHLVVLREAQDLKKLEELEPLLLKPVQSTVFVISHKGKVDGRKKWVKGLGKVGKVMLSEKVKEWDLGKWVMKEAVSKGLKLDVKAGNMLVEFVGDDLSRMSHNLDKLSMLAKKGETVDAVLIEKVIGVSKEYNMFEMQDALLNKDAFKAQQIVKYFAADPKNHSLQMVIAVLFGFYSKLVLIHGERAFDSKDAARLLNNKEFYVRKLVAGARKYSYGSLIRCISVLREYDMKSKGVGASASTSNGELMKEMVFKLTH